MPMQPRPWADVFRPWVPSVRVSISVVELPFCFLRLFAVLDDIALAEEHFLARDLPFRLAAEKKLEIHREVLELLLLRVLHDRARLGVLLDREALFVPVDCFSFLDHREAHPGKRSGLLG